MENNRLLSIKEFAKLSGKSKQAIYKQLNNRLNQYVQLVDNQKMLEYRALSEIYGVEVEQNSQPIQPKLNNLVNQNSTDFQPIIEVLQVTIDTLQSQLEVKDQQIEKLQQELAKERQHAREQSEKISVLADQAQRLQLAQLTSSSEQTTFLEDNKISKRHWWQRKKNIE
jgi:predicted phage tail protein